MNIHTRKSIKKPAKKPAKKKTTKRPAKSRRIRDLENTVEALRKMIPTALIHNIVTESLPPKYGKLEDRVTPEELASVNRILKEDLAPEPDSEHDFIPIQPSILDNMAPGTQAAITRVKLYGLRLRKLKPGSLAYWIEHKRIARMVFDVTGLWDDGLSEREYMEEQAEQQGKRTRAVYTDLLSPGDIEDVFAEA